MKFVSVCQKSIDLIHLRMQLGQSYEIPKVTLRSVYTKPSIFGRRDHVRHICSGHKMVLCFDIKTTILGAIDVSIVLPIPDGLTHEKYTGQFILLYFFMYQKGFRLAF